MAGAKLRQISIKLAGARHSEPDLNDPGRWWRPGWVPVFDTGGGFDVIIDSSGGRDAAAPLRLIDFADIGHDRYAPAIAPSLGEFLLEAIRALQAGRYRFDPHARQWLPDKWKRLPLDRIFEVRERP